VEVRDRGRGVPEGELERIFEGFHRASNAGEVRGAGLGLSLVRHFATAHGGEIVARAREGGGTVLRLSLPRAASRAAPHRPEATDRT
ncbi:MAG: sensor histidine kinase, partial [Planctomycetes bacterium]|nr:sensor histidine kinase [Planctomycetota bacterium]